MFHVRWAWMLVALLGLTTAVQADNWPQFRGPNRDGFSQETGLMHSFPEGGPEVLWETDVCDGFSAASIYDGKVFFNDYDTKRYVWQVRCVALDTGEPVWTFSEHKWPKGIRSNHGITRTIPSVDGKHVYSLDAKCVLHCLDIETGYQIWRINFPRQYGSPPPQWNAGQCPLLDGDRVIVSPGKEILLAAFNKETGEPMWETPDDEPMEATHSSPMPAVIDGVEQYVICNRKKIVGVDTDGNLLWSFPFRFGLAVPVSLLPLPDGRIFVTQPYDVESFMLRVSKQDDKFVPEIEYSLERWNSELQTPVFLDDHLFGVGKLSKGLFTCIDPNQEGVEIWDSKAAKHIYGSGNYIVADGMFLILEADSGILRLLEATSSEYKVLDEAKVLEADGKEVWGPIALSDGKIVVRDRNKMKCLQVAEP